MASNLAIAVPAIGAPSETFIRRHVEDLIPDSSVVVTYTANKEYGGVWKPSCPTLITDMWQSRTIVHRLGSAAARKLDNIEWDIVTVSKVKHFLRHHRVDAILGEYLDNSFNFFKISQKLNIPYFAHAHGVDISVALRREKWQRKYLEYRAAAGIITVSHLSRARLVELGLDPANIHVIPCGVDVPPAPTLRGEQNDIHCLAVGRMVPKKAPLLLLESFRLALAQCPELKLHYVGGGPLLESVRQFICEHQLENHITLHGVQPSWFVQNLLKQSDIFLQHSVVDPTTGDEEGLPVSILEAMANALPVVATRHAGIPEAVLEEETGLLVDEGDTVGMSQHILTLCHSSSLRQRLGTAGWQRADALFSWQKEREALLQLIKLQN